jgi:phosphatidate cytidylyltransferase
LALGNLAQRFLVAVVAVPVLIVILYVLKSPEPTWILIFTASLIAMREFFAMTLPAQDRVPALILGGLAAAAFYWCDLATLSSYNPVPGTLTYRIGVSGSSVPLFLAVVAPGLYYLFRFRDIPSVAGRYAATVTGIVYAGFLTTYLAKLKAIEPNTGDLVLLVLIVAWLADTGGYFAGRFLGKAKLYEAVSPKKTWAGAWGGIAGSLVGVIALKLIHAHFLSWLDVVLIAIPGGILGQLGDLTESLIKRSVGVKDSGALLPGHGGLLDRIDAVLFIAPYVYGYLLLK